MKRRLTAVLLAVLLCVSCAACSGSSDERSAVETIKTFIKAVEENDTETQQECMDPSVNSFSKGFVDSVGDLFGISGAYDMANGAAGLLGSLSGQALGIELAFDFKDVIESDLSDNSGNIRVEYELCITHSETNEKFKQDISWLFYMVKKDSKWYIQHFDDPEIVLSEEEQKEKEEYNAVGTVVQGISDGGDFSDDVAWVICEEDNIKKHYCVDKSGVILFELEPDYEPEYMSFKNGTSVLVYKEFSKEEEYCIVDKTGKITRLVEEGTPLSVVEQTEDGNIIVKAEFSDIKGNQIKYGLMDSKGDYIIPLSDDSVSGVSYLGDSIYAIDKYMGGGKREFYNAKTQKNIEISYNGEFRSEFARRFNNGYSISICNSSDENGNTLNYVFRTSSETGKVERLFAPYVKYDEEMWGQQYYNSRSLEFGEFSNGLLYIKDREYNSDDRGFFDMQGNLVIDLSEYEVPSYPEPCFVDGYCALNINGFCLFMDTKGNQIMEPFEISGDPEISNGTLKVRQDEGICFYDMSGNIVYGPDSQNSVYSYNCDRLKIEKTDGVHYLDKSGNLVF